MTEKKVFNRTALGVGVLEDTIEYGYATSGWKDRLVSYNGQTITYDALGNPTSYRGHTLVWGKVKQLQAYDTNSFTYNAEGIRTSKNGITYELDGTQILREVRGANVIEYFYGSGGVAGFSYNGTQYYYQKNAQGDIIAIYTTSGTKVAEYVYDAWGKCTVVLDTDGIGTLNPFRYRSYYFDIETGLYYLKTRYYDPEVGRFVNADSLVSTGQGILGHNMFAYCLNSPVSRKDVSGSISRALKDDYDLIDWLLDYGPIDGGHLYTGGAYGERGISGGGGGLKSDEAYEALIESLAVLLALLGLKQASDSQTKTNIRNETTTKTKDEEESSYWVANLVNNKLIIGAPLTFQEACERVAKGGNVVCSDQKAALAIVIHNRYRNAVGPEISNVEGALWHYHPTRNHTGVKKSTHIWFYGGPV